MTNLRFDYLLFSMRKFSAVLLILITSLNLEAQSANDSVIRPFSELLASQKNMKAKLKEKVQISLDSSKKAFPAKQGAFDSLYTQMSQFIEVLDTFKQDENIGDSIGVYNLNIGLHQWELHLHETFCPGYQGEFNFPDDTSLAMAFHYSPQLANQALRQMIQIHLYNAWLSLAYCKMKEDEEQH